MMLDTLQTLEAAVIASEVFLNPLLFQRLANGISVL